MQKIFLKFSSTFSLRLSLADAERVDKAVGSPEDGPIGGVEFELAFVAAAAASTVRPLGVMVTRIELAGDERTGSVDLVVTADVAADAAVAAEATVRPLGVMVTRTESISAERRQSLKGIDCLLFLLVLSPQKDDVVIVFFSEEVLTADVTISRTAVCGRLLLLLFPSREISLNLSP